MPEGKAVILTLLFASGTVAEIEVPIKKIKRIDWFEWCQQCNVNEDIKNAPSYLKQLVREQIAQNERDMAKITRYTQLGWNTDVFGNAVYVFGNGYVGGDKRAEIDPSLQEYELQFCEHLQGEMLSVFVGLWSAAPSIAKLTLLYFFTGLLRQLYKDAGVPVDFVLYLSGIQQSRKTTLVKETCSLYCRDTEMDFALRTVEKTSIPTAEKLISAFKDTTLVLDDVSKTGNRNYQKTQEEIVEKVTRMIGNRSRKSSSLGNGIREYMPNANVVFTGEYIPCLPESTLSRMLIAEITSPVDSSWLTEFVKEPLMFSTVAYSFIAWVQLSYEKIMCSIGKNFANYRKKRGEEVPYQERIQEHAFILRNTYYLLSEFMSENGYLEEMFCSGQDVSELLHQLLEKQVEIMGKTALKDMKQDFCQVFAKLYTEGQLEVAESFEDYDKKRDDGFKRNGCICISTAKICSIMRHYYKDYSITVKAITKQLNDNHFLVSDSNRNTKKVNAKRYLHIIKSAVKDYYKYCRC